MVHSAFCQGNNKQGYACTASVGGIRDHGIAYKDSTWNKKELELEDCSGDCKIVSYTVTLTIKGLSRSIDAHPNFLAIYMFQCLKSADRGSKIIYSDIKYSVPGGSIRTIMHPITITVK